MPTAHEFVWLECWVSPKYRGTDFASQFVKDALKSLRGTHHLHYFPSITTFSNLEKELGFSRHGTSQIFEDCVARRYLNKRSRQSADLKLTKRVRTCPLLKVAKTGTEGKRISEKIEAHFTHRQKRGQVHLTRQVGVIVGPGHGLQKRGQSELRSQ